MRVRGAVVAGIGLAWALARGPAPLVAQRGGMFLGSADDPAIAYSTASLNNVVASVNRKLQDGAVHLTFQGRSGYLQSALDALDISVDSQMLVFSPTSLQARRINERNPRALFFNDRVALGWVRDGDFIEVAAHDATEGVVFYTLSQQPTGRPEFRRSFRCLACHVAGDTLGVPGLLMFSTTTSPDGAVKSVATDHRSPLADRFGGWYVTGSVSGLFDADGYPSMSSDIAALLVLSHQTHMTNLLTRAGWEARAADPLRHPPFVAAPGEEQRIGQMMNAVAAEVVDYLLFVDEAPLEGVPSSSGFIERFAAAGPRDAKGRSLHQLDLTRRLMKYPCSYMVYSDAFDALPPAAKDPIYRRMWEVLSGADGDARYRSALSRADRQAVVEILRDTKKDLPVYFGAVSR